MPWFAQFGADFDSLVYCQEISLLPAYSGYIVKYRLQNEFGTVLIMITVLVIQASEILHIFTSRMLQSSKLPVLNLLTGQKSGFSPHRGDSLHQFTSNLAGPTGTLVCLAVQNFTSIATWGGNAAPKYQKFPLFGKESPRRGDSLDRFLNF